VLLLLASFAFGQAQSNSALGRFFHEPINLALAWAAAVLLAGIAERMLTRMGYPLLVVVPASVVFPPETELLKLPNFVPGGFKCGVEILNDNGTPMEFVVEVLQADFGLSHRDAARTMLSIHYRGGALLPLASMSLAETAAQAVSAKASAKNHPLICRAVGHGRSL
jgi:ATP-dependent Clp protease adapter protein ClpS